MQNLFRVGLVAVVALSIGTIALAKAFVAAPTPVSQRAITAPVIVVGKITGIEKEIIQAESNPGTKQMVPHQVATLKIEDSLRGIKGVTHIRIGFVPQPKVEIQPGIIDPNVPNVRQPAIARRPFRPSFQVNFEEGLEGCFFLTKHHKEDFYVVVPMYMPLLKKDETYKRDIATITKTQAVLADPMKALKSDKEPERRFAAGVLVMAYRSPPSLGRPSPMPPKSELVSIEETKLILETLVNADWKKYDPETDVSPPQSLFFTVGMQPKDGWTPPKFTGQPNYQDLMQAAAKEWVAKNGEYRMERFIAEKK